MNADSPQFGIIATDMAMASLLSELHQMCFDDPWDSKAMADLLLMPGTTGFVITAPSDIPAGFVLANCASDQADILTIGICPKYRRVHLGERLLKYLGDHLLSMGVLEIFLEVAADNEAAICLYKKCGYIEVGARENYYPMDRDNRRAIQMKCALGA